MALIWFPVIAGRSTTRIRSDVALQPPPIEDVGKRTGLDVIVGHGGQHRTDLA